METKLATAFVEIRADQNPLLRGFASAKSATLAFAKSASASITDHFRRAGQDIGRYLSMGFKAAGVALAASGVAAVKLAASAQESENLFEVSMEGMAKSARKWSEDLRGSLGLNSIELRKMVGTFNVMLRGMGVGRVAAADMSKELTELAYDMASFYNLKPEEAFLKLSAGLSGEAEPLKRLGIIITGQTTLMGRYNKIIESTRKAHGDLARTSGSFTNQLRIFMDQVKQLGAELGSVFLPKLTEWISKGNELVKVFGPKLKEQLGGLIDVGKGIFETWDLQAQIFFKKLQKYAIEARMAMETNIVGPLVSLGGIPGSAASGFKHASQILLSTGSPSMAIDAFSGRFAKEQVGSIVSDIQAQRGEQSRWGKISGGLTSQIEELENQVSAKMQDSVTRMLGLKPKHVSTVREDINKFWESVTDAYTQAALRAQDKLDAFTGMFKGAADSVKSATKDAQREFVRIDPLNLRGAGTARLSRGDRFINQIGPGGKLEAIRAINQEQLAELKRIAQGLVYRAG